MRVGDHHGGNPAQRNAQIRNNLEYCHHQPDEQSKLYPKEEERQPNQRPVNHRHQNLTPEKRDQVAVNLVEAVHHLSLEWRSAQRQVIPPTLRNGLRVDEKIVEVERHEHQAQHKARRPKESLNAAADKSPGLERQLWKLLLHPVHDLWNVGILWVTQVEPCNEAFDLSRRLLLACTDIAGKLFSELRTLVINLWRHPKRNQCHGQEHRRENRQHGSTR